MTPLDPDSFATAVDHLARLDPDLARVREQYGQPPFFSRPPGFVSLVKIILEQQISLASAKATFDRVAARTAVTPESIGALDEQALRDVGVTRQKARYLVGLSRWIVDGELDLDAIATLNDEAARAELVRVKGIGNWTADVYLLLALGRADVFPVGDLALVVGVQEVKRLETRPKAEALEVIAEPWRPWRAVATRMVWHHYVNQRGVDISKIVDVS
ncbi:MAG: DNA-3-methyladenine glycosylase [Acidobacteriota bacterium]